MNCRKNQTCTPWCPPEPLEGEAKLQIHGDDGADGQAGVGSQNRCRVVRDRGEYIGLQLEDLQGFAGPAGALRAVVRALYSGLVVPGVSQIPPPPHKERE